MESFRRHFPEQADRETLVLEITDEATVPSGTYLEPVPKSALSSRGVFCRQALSRIPRLSCRDKV